MQRQTVLVVVAVLAAVATALWLWPLRPASSPPAAAAPSPAPALAAPPVPTPKAPTAPVPAAPLPTVEAPPVAPVEAAKPAPPPVAAPKPETAVEPAPAGDAAPAIPAEGEAAGATDGSPDADAGEPAPAPAIDEDHAIDLFAERMAALEQGGEDDADRNDASQQKEFDGRGDGGEDAATRTRELRAHLQAWIAGLSPDHPHDVLLASVECRDGGCRVLVAEGGVDLSGQAETAGNAAVNSLQESFLALRSADWWQQLQLGEASLSRHAADPATAPGYVLWTIYIGVVGASGGDAAAAPAG
jgi:hypothetical protein